jgi:hypothetical protein
MNNYSPKYNYEKEINYICRNDIYCIITFYDNKCNVDRYYIYEKWKQIYPIAIFIDIVKMCREINLNILLTQI